MKRIFIVAGFIILAIFVFLNRAPVIEEQDAKLELSAPTTEAKKSPEVKKNLKDKLPINNQVIEDEWAWETKNFEDDWCHLDELNDAGIDQFEKIIREHQYKQGYFPAGINPMAPSDFVAVDFEDYRSYDIKTLKDLGKEGDLRALTSLFDKKEATSDEKYWAGRTASIYGGTYLPMMLSNQVLVDAFVETLNSEFQADNKSKYIDGLAWAYFSAMRGDLNSWNETMIHFEKFGRVHFSTGRLENEDLEVVKLKAHEYYQSVITERKKRNLGEFEKLPPKVATALASEILAEDLARGYSDLWPKELIPKDNDCFNRVVSWVREGIEAEALRPQLEPAEPL